MSTSTTRTKAPAPIEVGKQVELERLGCNPIGRHREATVTAIFRGRYGPTVIVRAGDVVIHVEAPKPEALR